MKKITLCATALTLSALLGACSSAPSPSPSDAPPGVSSAAPSDAATGYPGDGALFGGEDYLVIDENREVPTDQNSMLTFSLKVDTASYTNVQRYLESGSLPPQDAVRTEELINYFSYDQPVEPGSRDQPFAIHTETAPSPFDPGKQIAFVRVKTPDIDKRQLPASNLTFLIDTSGSMNAYDKLPLLKQAFALLVETLGEDDRVSIVTYAGSAGVVLDSASGGSRRSILAALDDLEAGGSTAGAEGIVSAYQLAEKNFIKGGNNRVILATDGDFNVGPSSNEALSRLIREKSDSGVYLSILGFGTGNIRDDLMETLSKDGNGNYAYINSVRTAEKVLVEELASNLFTVADDVKAQIEFNPRNVAAYRLIGYENRALRNEDFADDRKDAGEIGAGTDVVALFELTLQGASTEGGLKYGQQAAAVPAPQSDAAFGDELFEVRIRYKEPGGSQSKLVTRAVTRESILREGSSDLQFACAVAQFGELLRDSKYTAVDTAQEVYAVAKENLGRDQNGYRKEFLTMLKQYQRLTQ